MKTYPVLGELYTVEEINEIRDFFIEQRNTCIGEGAFLNSVVFHMQLLCSPHL